MAMRQRLIVLAACSVWAVLGCNGTPNGKTEPTEYTLFGLAELNLEMDAEYLYVQFLKETEPIPGSFAKLGTDTLFFNENGVIDVTVDPGTWKYNTMLAVTVFDTSADFTYTVTERMPVNVTITDFVPTNHLYSGGSVVVGWISAGSPSGVLITCVPRSLDSYAPGFAASYGSGVSTATIGPEAFVNPYSGERVADSFFVYVTAYDPTFEIRPGAAYTALERMENLSFPNSLSGANISGIFGAAVVSSREILEVLAQE